MCVTLNVKHQPTEAIAMSRFLFVRSLSHLYRMCLTIVAFTLMVTSSVSFAQQQVNDNDDVLEIETDDPNWTIALDMTTGESVLISATEFFYDDDSPGFVMAHYVDEFGDTSWLLYDGLLNSYNGPTGNVSALSAPNPVRIIIQIIKQVFTKVPKKAPPVKLPVTKVPGKKPPLKAGEKVESEHTLPDGTVIRKIKTPEGPIRTDETSPITVGSGQPGAPGTLPVNPPPTTPGTP